MGRMKDVDFCKMLSIWRRPRKTMKYFYPITIKDAQGKIIKEVTEVKLEEKRTPFNREEY